MPGDIHETHKVTPKMSSHDRPDESERPTLSIGIESITILGLTDSYVQSEDNRLKFSQILVDDSCIWDIFQFIPSSARRPSKLLNFFHL